MLFLIALLIILIDQLTKLLIVNTMSQNESIPVITNIFHITYVHNFGAAFGLLAHRTGFFILVTVVLVLLLLAFLRYLPKEQKLLRSALVLLLGGATGNLIDRVRVGYVIDFFDFRVWPVFNVADIAIVFGIGLLILDLTRNAREKGA
ncbi:MAG: signal peptidase II [Dethiobacter sp.]|nr:signal peptidase II [Dethiobacter sp.]MBS3900890.1 signal peptidase II [Dethiobacter sp.]MBS3990384.1 signal peptidase II [Dethiobacter sp.]